MSTDTDNKPTVPLFIGAPAENERVEERHVHAACDALNAQGKKPTFEAIRELLGKGSFSTISEFLKTWRPKALDLAPPLPDRLVETGQAFAMEFWREAVLQANSQLVQERKTAREDLEEAHAAIRALEAQAEADQVRLAEADQKLQQATTRLRNAHNQHTELRDKLVRCEGELKILRPLMQRLKLGDGDPGSDAGAP